MRFDLDQSLRRPQRLLQLLRLVCLATLANCSLVAVTVAENRPSGHPMQMPSEHPDQTHPNQSLSASTTKQPLSVEGLRSYCGAEAPCGSTMACEGRLVRLSGEVDAANVWERSKHPWLPSDKFFLRDRGGTAMIEVRLEIRNPDDLFRKLRLSASNASSVLLLGRIIGVDSPAMQSCRREIAVVVERRSALTFLDEFR